MADRASKNEMPEGVRIRDGAIQIYSSRKYAEFTVTLPHPPTTEGIKAAAQIRSDLITKGKWGILTEKDLDVARGLIEYNDLIVEDGVLFQEVAQRYLRHNKANQDSKKDYVSALNKHWMPHMALIPIHMITADYIQDVIVDENFKSKKTLNNCLIPLRGVFKKAIEMGLIDKNPMSNISNEKVQRKLPDPFTRDEMNALLDWMDKKLEGDDHFYYWYFELAFWTGCRPSEMLALRWNDIDWFNESILINKTRVRGVEKNVTKTHEIREVYLNDRSKRALEGLESIKASKDYVLICPTTGEPFFNEKPPRLRIVDAMKACRIRHRPAYNTRHTYATMLLMDGVNPVFVANQLGHSLQMLIKRYGRWIHGDQNKIEMGKLRTD